jgi:hypothetical protein
VANKDIFYLSEKQIRKLLAAGRQIRKYTQYIQIVEQAARLRAKAPRLVKKRAAY